MIEILTRDTIPPTGFLVKCGVLQAWHLDTERGLSSVHCVHCHESLPFSVRVAALFFWL